MTSRGREFPGSGRGGNAQYRVRSRHADAREKISTVLHEEGKYPA
jgi:hypothetical protein